VVHAQHVARTRSRETLAARARGLVLVDTDVREQPRLLPEFLARIDRQDGNAGLARRAQRARQRVAVRDGHDHAART
jgi:hypothetical protein